MIRPTTASENNAPSTDGIGSVPSASSPPIQARPIMKKIIATDIFVRFQRRGFVTRNTVVLSPVPYRTEVRLRPRDLRSS